MIYEACIENLEFLEENIKAGANRIELCDNLAVGGTTPSFATIKYAKERTAMHNVELAVIIRPRGGNFVYTDLEKEIILTDMEEAIKLGADRIVVGALKDEDVDFSFMNRLSEHLQNISSGNFLKPNQISVRLTFHMAFDHIKDYNKRLYAIQKLKDFGVDTILTHGGLDNDIMDNLEVLRSYFKVARQFGMIIMPGGGIHFSRNRNSLIQALQEQDKVRAIHGTKIVRA